MPGGLNLNAAPPRAAPALGGGPDSWLAARLDYAAPVALGGCRRGPRSFACCEYNVTVFDGHGPTEELEDGGRIAIIRHDSATDPSSGTFAHLAGLRVISDPEWALAPRISAAAEARGRVFAHAAKSALVDAEMMAIRARASLSSGSREAPFWLKCAAYSLAGALSYHAMAEPSPAHMMAAFRAMQGPAPGDALQAVGECLGLERATPSLVSRMARSAAGFARMAGAGPLAVAAMEAKAAHLASESLLADCHYYVGHAACAALRARRAYAHGIPDAEFHALRVALDPEGNAQRLERHAGLVEAATAGLAARVGWAAPRAGRDS